MHCKYSRLGSDSCPFLFFRLHDLFDLLSINQQRMCLNDVEVYLRKLLYSPGCLCSPSTCLGSRP